MKKNLRNRILSLLLAVTMIVGLVPGTAVTAFAEENPTGTPAVEDAGAGNEDTIAVTGITLDQEAVEVKVGETVILTPTVAPEDATDKTVVWSSDNEAAATVADGVVTAVAEGTATIIAKAGEVSAECAVTVLQQDTQKKNDTETITETEAPVDIAAAIMSLTDEGIALAAETDLNVTDNVIDITDRNVYTYSRYSTTATALTISGATVVSATEDGTTITITLSNETASSATVTAEINYSNTDSRILTVSQTSKTLELTNGSGVLNTTIKSSFSSRKSGSVTYTINFQCEAAGTAEIDSIEVARKDGSADFSVNETLTMQLAATVSPADAKSRKVIWSSFDENIATVDQKGVVTGIKQGTVKIRATSDVDSTKYGEKEITVLPVPENSLLLGITTSNGSIDRVTFTDSSSNPLAVAQRPTLEGTAINVILSKNVNKSEKITARFSRTANSSDIPFLTPNNAFNRAYSNRTDTYTTTLSGGKGTATIYMYNAEPKATSNSYTTYTINYKTVNAVPSLTDKAEDSVQVAANAEYKISLAGLFTDADGDTLSYKYSTDGTSYTSLEGDEYTFIKNISGEYKVYFKANDGLGDSDNVYTVTIHVTNSNVVYQTQVLVPQDITPVFYITNGKADDGTDNAGEELQAQAGITENSFTAYTVSVPENITRISLRGKGSSNAEWGGMSFVTKDTEGNVLPISAILVKVQGEVVDYSGKKIDGNLSSAEYSGYKAVKGENGFLLCADNEYTFEATPADTQSYVKNSKKETVTKSADVFVVQIEVLRQQAQKHSFMYTTNIMIIQNITVLR